MAATSWDGNLPITLICSRPDTGAGANPRPPGLRGGPLAPAMPRLGQDPDDITEMAPIYMQGVEMAILGFHFPVPPGGRGHAPFSVHIPMRFMRAHTPYLVLVIRNDGNEAPDLEQRSPDATYANKDLSVFWTFTEWQLLTCLYYRFRFPAFCQERLVLVANTNAIPQPIAAGFAEILSTPGHQALPPMPFAHRTAILLQAAESGTPDSDQDIADSQEEACPETRPFSSASDGAPAP